MAKFGLLKLKIRGGNPTCASVDRKINLVFVSGNIVEGNSVYLLMNLFFYNKDRNNYPINLDEEGFRNGAYINAITN